MQYLSPWNSKLKEVIFFNYLGIKSLFLSEISVPRCGIFVLLGITFLIGMSLPYLGSVSTTTYEDVS